MDNLFKNKKLQYSTSDFGKLSLIVNAFQSCYLNSNKTDSHFLNLINSAEGDYSRYLFFYLSNVIENKDYKTAKQISNKRTSTRCQMNFKLSVQYMNYLVPTH